MTNCRTLDVYQPSTTGLRGAAHKDQKTTDVARKRKSPHPLVYFPFGSLFDSVMNGAKGLAVPGLTRPRRISSVWL